MAEFEVTKHVLVPKHSKVSEKELKEVLERYSIEINMLPRISKSDPAIANLDVKEGDVVKIVRNSPTAGRALFYRRVSP